MIKSKNTGTIFVVTTISGAIFEFFCSYVQEMIFGTVSWDYGNQPFTIGGRANLLFACVLIVFMVVNIFISATAVKRQTDRRQGIVASNSYERFLDRKYPDDVKKRIYANMRVVD